MTRALHAPGVTLLGVRTAPSELVRVEQRMKAAVAAHHTFVWRSLRRFGVAEEQADDAAQQVFCVLARRLDDVPPEKEKTFLCGVAVRVTQSMRRQRGRRPVEIDDAELASAPSSEPGPDEQLDDHRARAILDEVLQAMPDDLRAVFVLHAIEELTMSEIAAILVVPAGTVASRLRRAREVFAALAEHARLAAATSDGGPR